MNKNTFKDIGWHGAKAILCALQLRFLDLMTQSSTGYLWNFLTQEALFDEDSKPILVLFSLVRPLVTVVMFLLLWRYYDSIDDHSFNRFRDDPSTRRVFRNAGWLSELLVTVAGVTPILTMAFLPTMSLIPWHPALAVAAAILVSLIIAAGCSALRLKLLAEKWDVQKDMGTYENTATVKHVLKRIFYAAVYFVALALVINLGFSVLFPVWGSLIVALGQVMFWPVVFGVIVLSLWFFFFDGIRGLISRRKFMRRLEKLRDRGELSFEVHGHPYLSVLSERVFFGLTIVDVPHPDGRKRKETTYKVAFANCKHRRGVVVLCQGNVYRFMYAFNFRTIASHDWGGLSVASASIVTMPVGAVFTNHTFDFPEGEGERILLIDPTPRILCMPGPREGEMITLDNDSKIFGYTVYGKNSFVNVLERT